MLQPLLVYAFSLLVGLAGLAACAWVIVTGQALTLDGLLMMAISLTVGAIFAANVAWAWHGERLAKSCKSSAIAPRKRSLRAPRAAREILRLRTDHGF